MVGVRGSSFTPQPAETDTVHLTDAAGRHALYDDCMEPRAFLTRAMSLVHHLTTKENRT